MTDEPQTLIYLYGIVPSDAPDPAPDLLGLDEGPVFLVRLGAVGAVVSAVDAGRYSDDALNARLDDLAWVGAQGLSHERVLDWYAERGPVVPLSLFSIHHDAGRVENRLRAEEGELLDMLESLRGRREWGVKLWRRDGEAREGIDRISLSLQQLAKEIEDAPPGKRFLLERKRESLRAEELRTASKRLAHEVFGSLERIADRGASVPLPQAPPGEKKLLLHAAFLLPDSAFERFQQELSEHAKRLAGSGFELEFTGPWPPYHFTGPADE